MGSNLYLFSMYVIKCTHLEEVILDNNRPSFDQENRNGSSLSFETPAYKSNGKRICFNVFRVTFIFDCLLEMQIALHMKFNFSLSVTKCRSDGIHLIVPLFYGRDVK